MLQLLLTEFEPTYTYVYTSEHKISWEDYKFYLPMAILCFVMAAWMLYSKAYKYTLLKKACTYPVEARIFATDYKHGGRGGRFWNVTYEFFYNERRYIASNDIWEQTGRIHKPHEGDVVSIFINPLNPNEYYDFVANSGRTRGLIIGPLFIALGIFMLLMPMLAY